MEASSNFPKIFERVGDPERLRGGGGPPHRGHKISCFILVFLFAIVFLSGILILSLRQDSGLGSEGAEKVEEQKANRIESEVDPLQLSSSPPTTWSTSSTSSSPARPDLDLDIKVGELGQLLKNRIHEAERLSQDEQFRQEYKDFRFHNVSSQDFVLTTELVRNRSKPDAPKYFMKDTKTSVKRVVEALAMNIAPPSSEVDLPHILVFDKPTGYEENMKEMRSRLDELLNTIEEAPSDIVPLVNVWDYLKIQTQSSEEEEPTTSESPEDEVIHKLVELNVVHSVPEARTYKCLEGETPCGINQTECYSDRVKCDGKVDCSDFADEIQCSACKTFIDIGDMGISRKGAFVCDNHWDCPDGEDEKNCGSVHCQPHEYHCPMSDICIPYSNRCNFEKNCPDGSDEKGCVALWPQPQESESPLVASPHTVGILHWRVNETWRVLSLFDKDKIDFINNRSREICTEILLHDGGVLPRSHNIQHHFEVSDISGQPRPRTHYPGRSALQSFSRHDEMKSSYYVLMDCGIIECGARPYAYQPEMSDVSSFFEQRIVGGDESIPFDWPSMVAIYIDGILLCGGALIDKNWVLSAAHCYKEVREGRSVVEVFAGMSRVDSRSPYTQVRQVKEIIHHGYFNRTYLTHDVALLYFDEPLAFNAKVNPVCLNNDPSLPTIGEHCYTVGWGSTHEAENNVNNELLEVEVPIKSKCIQGYNDLEHQICGGFPTGGRDACQGDSGGPLYCASSGQDGFNRHYLAGVVSHGIGCARPETDGVYVRVTYYLDWIEKIMEIKTDELNDRRYQRSVDMSGKFRSIAKEKHPDISFVHRVLNLNCPSGVRCDDHRCIPQSNVCDGKFQCMDRQDELNCKMNDQGNRKHIPGYWDTLSQFLTTMSTTYAQEVTTTATSSKTTELSPTIEFLPNKDMKIYLKPKECEDDFFTCRHIHDCIPLSKRCDFKKDCIDGSDEMGCSCRDYFNKNDSRICDGYPDCPDLSDEADCQTCKPNEYHCSLSAQCIPHYKLCDLVTDCEYGEDEKYCVALIPYAQKEGIKIVYSKSENRPLKYNHGYVALNYKGSWSSLCVNNESVWSSSMNDRVCQYQNSLKGLDYNFVSSDEIKDKDFLNSILKVEREDGSQIHSFGANNPSSTCETGVIQASCSETTRCGTHPLYNKLSNLDFIEKMDKEGLFPWHVTLYQEGRYVCGATLIHRNWIMTSKECSSKMDPSRKYVVARMGGHRNGKFLSPQEQVRQVIQFTRVPHTGISLGTFRNAVDLGDYVNPICIPSTNWFPSGGKCIITGIDHRMGILNRGVKLSVDKICDINQIYDYYVCTEFVNRNEDVCMDNWSGTLACQGESDRYYVLGVYHTTNGGCEDPNIDGKVNPFPTKFRSVSTATARDAIRKIVGIFNTNESVWYDAHDDCPTHRCPLGKCLDPSQVCDGIAQCEDMSDEDEYFCSSRPSLNFKDTTSHCSPINSTHCACDAGEFKCRKSHICVHENKFCDGINDCGDFSDEPPGCEVCVTALETLKPSSICDGRVDCLGESNSIASDESAKVCCDSKNSSQSFRCVIGNMGHGNTLNLIIGNDCVDRRSVCDHCKGHSSSDCQNDADDMDCLAISPRDSSYSEDVFGRPESSPQGYLHYIAYGKRYLYCAGSHFYDVLEKRPHLREKAAEILCRSKGYRLGGQLTFHKTVEKQYVYSYGDAEEDGELCKLVYIVCRNRRDNNLVE